MGHCGIQVNSVMCVKSDAHSFPGTCVWPKYTSCAGPSVARHSLIRRCRVRIIEDRLDRHEAILQRGRGLIIVLVPVLTVMHLILHFALKH